LCSIVITFAVELLRFQNVKMEVIHKVLFIMVISN
jgi:hypothetical protein